MPRSSTQIGFGFGRFRRFRRRIDDLFGFARLVDAINENCHRGLGVALIEADGQRQEITKDRAGPN
jgi:hypothetical protein